jgi:hypothetical protein
MRGGGELSGGSCSSLRLANSRVFALTANTAVIAGATVFARRPVRQAILSSASGPTNAKGGRQNDASHRFPLKHQSPPLTGCVSWTRCTGKRFAPPCSEVARPKISAARDGIVASTIHENI